MFAEKNLTFALIFGVLLAFAVSCRPAAAAEGLVGGLYVESKPEGARVYIGGQLKGVTPCGIADVGIGEIQLKVMKEGRGTAHKTVTVKANKVEKVEVKLAPLKNVGNIIVLVEPTGAKVTVDHVPFGKSPCRITNLQAKTHHVKVSQDGYRPMVTQVSVAAGKKQVVKGELEEAGWLSGTTGGEKELEWEDFDEDEVPLPDEMPEAQAFQPVRELLRERKYDRALATNNRMGRKEEMQKYQARITRDRRYIKKAKEITKAGYEALKRKVGQNYPLPLSGGINVTGKVLSVTSAHITLDMGARSARQIDLDKIHIDRVIKLAAGEYSPDKGANQALFAVIYAMEGEFKDAIKSLRLAAKAGYNVTEAKSFIESEQLWAAAQRKARRVAKNDEKRKESEEKREELSGTDSERKPIVLIDRHRGEWFPKEISGPLKKLGLQTRNLRESPTKEKLSEAAVLVIMDPGSGDFIAPFKKEEVKSITHFVSNGGGLLFRAHWRVIEKDNRDNPFNPLLSQFKIEIKADRMEVSRKAPHSHYRVPGIPAQRHPITEGLDKVEFRTTCSAILAPKSMWLLKSSKYVRTKLTKMHPVPLVVGRQAGKGRVVVFAGMPNILDEEHGMDGVKLMVNSIRWVAVPALKNAQK